MFGAKEGKEQKNTRKMNKELFKNEEEMKKIKIKVKKLKVSIRRNEERYFVKSNSHCNFLITINELIAFFTTQKSLSSKIITG